MFDRRAAHQHTAAQRVAKLPLMSQMSGVGTPDSELPTNDHRLPAMRTRILLPLLLFAAHSLVAQILPARLVIYDPLGNHTPDSSGFEWLPATRLYAEFS